MSLPTPDSAVLERWSRRVACALSALFVLLFLNVARHRLHYPFELDRMESGMMTTVWRLVHGRPLYSAPSMEWVPFLYAPLFFYLSSALSHLTGLNYGTLRLISILSTLGSFGVIYGLVYRETKRFAAALVAVGLFACLYEFCLGWFDVGRVDSLSIFLFLAALYATRWTNPLIAACLWLLAFHSKQTFLPFGLLAFLPLWQTPRRMLTGMVAFGAMALASVYWLNHASAGWYGHYAFGTTRQLGLDVRQGLLFLPMDLVKPLPVLITILLAAFILKPPSLRSSRTAFYGFMTILLTGAIGFVRAHTGANLNAILPLYAWFAILGGLSIHRVLVWLESSETGLSARHVQLASAVLWMAVSGQMLSHLYQVGHLLPQAADLIYRRQMLDAVRATPGDVWLANHSYDGIMAGKEVHPEMDALDAVLGLPEPKTVAEFHELIADKHFAAILLDRPSELYMPKGTFTSESFRESYGLRASAPGADQPGVIDQPQYSYLPCEDLGKTTPLLPAGVVVDASQCGAAR